MLMINAMMDKAPVRRFGFLINDISRLYTQLFDRQARQRLGLSQAQCRLLYVLASSDDGEPLSQAALAEKLGLTPMAVATMCDRMAAAGWIERQPSPTDRRVNRLHMLPKAREAMVRAIALADELTSQVLTGFGAAEREQLLGLLGRVRESAIRLGDAGR